MEIQVSKKRGMPNTEEIIITRRKLDDFKVKLIYNSPTCGDICKCVYGQFDNESDARKKAVEYATKFGISYYGKNV